MNDLKLLIEDLLILQGRSLALQNNSRPPPENIHDIEFKVFSQFGEDGIIQYLIHKTRITQNETIFIEFGVQNYEESNTRFLLVNNNWRGLVFDGSKEYIDHIQRQNYYWRNDITAVQAWIKKDNINQLLLNSGFQGEIGILSIDIDGNDYWVWDSITAVDPVIVIVEYNSLFGSDLPLSTPYKDNFQREIEHYSYLYWGGSISAFNHLAALKGYSLVCSNLAGNNLFFVKNERLNTLKPLTPREVYVECRFRESRDENGNLDYLAGINRLKRIRDQKLIDVTNDSEKSITELFSEIINSKA
jgi:hypothetical protein